MFQDENIIETLKIKKSQRNKNIKNYDELDVKERDINQFRGNYFIL